jgi:uncharacterized protein (DUF58 family)
MLYKQTVLLTGITFLGLTGYILRLEQLYFMTAVVALLAAGSYALCRLSVRGIELRRGPARKLREGEWCDLHLVLTNASRLPKVFLAVQDALPKWLEPAGESSFIVPVLLPGRWTQLTYRVRGTKRGAFVIGPVTISATDLMGAFRVERRLEAPQEVIVYPAAVRVQPEPRAGVLRFGGAETEQVSASGSGLEFYGIRDYRPGDALRRIHWPSTARLGHFAVVEFEETFGADVVLALDLRRGTEYGAGTDTTLEAAIKAAASLAAFAVENGAEATLAARDSKRSYRVAARRSQELPALLEALARMQADGDASPAEVMASIASAATGAAAVVLSAAPDEGLIEAVESWMRGQAHVAVVLLDGASWAGRDAPDVYQAARRLQAAGARVEILRRGDELQHLLARTMGRLPDGER